MRGLVARISGREECLASGTPKKERGEKNEKESSQSHFLLGLAFMFGIVKTLAIFPLRNKVLILL